MAAGDGVCAMAMMSKASVPGQCKTRLVPPLTYDEAARLNTSFLKDISANIAAAATQAPIHCYATCHPAGFDAFFAATLGDGCRLIHPPAPGLQLALAFSCRCLLEQGYRSVCLVNSDSPDLPNDYLVQAARALHEPRDRIVLGPSDDGGYYLIGMNRWHARVFEEIAWSTSAVLEQTLQRAGEIGVEVLLLPRWYDVDDQQTLQRLAAELMSAPSDGEGCADQSRALLRELRAAGRLPGGALARPEERA